MQAAAGRIAAGPDAAMLRSGRSYVWAQASAPDGQRVEGWIETMEAYRFTAVAGVRAVEQVLATQPTGALAPAQALGADFVLALPETARYDALEGAS